MSANKFANEFKRDAVAQLEDRGYRVREVACPPSAPTEQFSVIA